MLAKQTFYRHIYTFQFCSGLQANNASVCALLLQQKLPQGATQSTRSLEQWQKPEFNTLPLPIWQVQDAHSHVIYFLTRNSSLYLLCYIAVPTGTT
jgi:hypothetical protein